MKVGIATDHDGFGLEEEFVIRLRNAGHDLTDFGAPSLNPGDDYPDFIVPVADTVVAGESRASCIDLWQWDWRICLRQLVKACLEARKARPSGTVCVCTR